jgi:hypothetical protein
LNSHDERKKKKREKENQGLMPHPDLTENLSGYLENPDMERFDERLPEGSIMKESKD